MRRAILWRNVVRDLAGAGGYFVVVERWSSMGPAVRENPRGSVQTACCD